MPWRPLVHTVCLVSLTLGGCTSTAPIPLADISGTPPSALNEARHEIERLRSDLAAARILVAKREAEILDLQQLVTELRTLEHDLRNIADHHQAELISLKTRQETPRSASNVRPTPDLNSSEYAAQNHPPDLWTEIKELRRTVDTLSGRLNQPQNRQAVSSSVPETHAKRPAPASIAAPLQNGEPPSAQAETAPSGRSAHKTARPVSLETADAPKTVLVQPGDSLWLLARRFHCSTDELKSLNRLHRDTVVVGQRLIVPDSKPIPSTGAY